MTSRRSSGSSCVDRAVEPTRSQNITAIWRRSATLAARVACGGAGAGEGAEAAGASPSLAPHCVQNREPAALAWPQDGKVFVCQAEDGIRNQRARAEERQGRHAQGGTREGHRR